MPDLGARQPFGTRGKLAIPERERTGPQLSRSERETPDLAYAGRRVKERDDVFASGHCEIDDRGRAVGRAVVEQLAKRVGRDADVRVARPDLGHAAASESKHAFAKS